MKLENRDADFVKGNKLWGHCRINFTAVGGLQIQEEDQTVLKPLPINDTIMQ